MEKFSRTTALNRIAKMKAKKKVVQGSSSAGKTFSILALLIDRCLKSPMLDVTVIGCTVPHLKDGAMKDFLKIMRLTKRFVPAQWNISDRKYTFGNGSVIQFVNADGDKAIGPRRDVLYINEANKIDYETYNQLAIRTSKDIYLDFNPVTRFWAHEEVLTESDSELLILTYRDNEALSKTIVKELESKRAKAATSKYWENWCKVYLDGEVGSLEGVIFSNWETIKQVPAEARLLGYGMDFGFSNDPTAIVAVYKWNDKVVLDQVCYRKNLLASEIAQVMRDMNVSGLVYADSADPRLIKEINNHKVANVLGVKKPRLRESLHLMQEYQYLVTERSKELIHELQNYRFEDESGVPVPGYDHAIDGARYVIWMKLGMREVDNSGAYSFSM